ncbi:hypothetical protein IB244_18520 [Rhizobium sp. RHZ02]|uniref:hypothetical protein n=1 Tax=Rhizobium sp. RHZ02 TaxID=2769306 RepID=UPI001781F70E|nr:hypothetical protein [Rhizobium sp. RHZ02]MBD9453535.1 hypothetical protein [Rhizobium sp. RHZ02]
MHKKFLTRIRRRLRRQLAARHLRSFFAEEWYLDNNPDVKTQGLTGLAHYLQSGWKEGRNPTPSFDVKEYLSLNPDVAASGVEPFTHFVLRGIKEGRRTRLGPETPTIANFFAREWYLETNPDVQIDRQDPLEHYLEKGWKEGRNPTPSFNVRSYLANNQDVAISGREPFTHFVEIGLKSGRPIGPPIPTQGRLPADFDHAFAFHSVQDQSFPREAETAEHLMVILIPEHNEMSGGIYSFFSIAKAAYNLRFKHNYFILLMTRPTNADVTYTRQKNFRNSEDVFRFDQLQRCRAARTVYIHVPEYAAPSFVQNLSDDMLHYLRSRERFYVNILNQKTDIMPSKEDFGALRGIADGLSQSVAHHAYFSQHFADKYDLPTLLLPAYTDLSGYEPLSFKDKEKLIIYSPDDAPWREATLKNIRENLPDYQLKEIRGITFDQYMDLATRCRFSVTFGEGFDGYLAQPIHQGGVGFAVYNEEFFPSADMLEYENIFSSGEDMENNLVSKIRLMEKSYSLYQSTNKKMISLYSTLYSKEDYNRRVMKLINREFEFYPLHMNEDNVGVRL